MANRLRSFIWLMTQARMKEAASPTGPAMKANSRVLRTQVWNTSSSKNSCL